MERLTKYMPDEKRYFYRGELIENITKLGQLEDIEEELGIDLITLFKTKTVFWKDQSGIHKSYECYIDLCFNELRVFEFPDEIYDSSGKPLPFKDYGKTWALTKEELE